MDKKIRQYAMISGISLILFVVSAFFWEQAGYAMPSAQCAAALIFGAAYLICGIKTSLLVPQKNAPKKDRDEVGDTQREMGTRQKAA